MNTKINKTLLNILSKGYIENEVEFRTFYNAKDETVGATEESDEKIHLVKIRTHLFGGYCEVQVYEKECRFSQSLFGFYEPDSVPVPIKFYNYEDVEIPSYKDLRMEQMKREMVNFKEKYIGVETSIEELSTICYFYLESDEVTSYFDYLEAKAIPFGFYEIDDKITQPVIFQFEVLEDYSMCTKDAWEVLKETKIRVTDVKILEKEENAYEYYIQAA